MPALRAVIEVFKFLSLSDLSAVSVLSSFHKKASENEEIWYDLLIARCEGLLLPETLALRPSHKQVYERLFGVAEVPLLLRNTITTFDITTGSSHVRKLSEDTLISKETCIVRLPDSSLFACGGGVRERWKVRGLDCVYRIGPVSPTVRSLPRMTQRRAFPGACYYSGGVCVFGGVDRMSLNTAEVYSFADNQWTALPDMPKPFCRCTPAVYRCEALVAVEEPGSWTIFQAFHFQARTYRSLRAVDWLVSGFVMVVHDCALLIFAREDMMKIDLRSSHVVKMQRLKLQYQEDGLWSPCTPVVRNAMVWFYCLQMGKVVCYDGKTKEFTEKKSFSFD